MVTANDIAQHVGVNQSTVSRVLSGFPHVSEQTAIKVRQACRELGYVPNAAARNLCMRKTHAIAVHIPLGRKTVFADPFAAELLIGINRECAAHDYTMILSFVAPDDPDVDLAHVIKARRADGLVLLGLEANDRRLAALREASIPCVVGHAAGPLGKQIVTVDVDNRDAGRRAAEFLIRSGHRRIGAILEPVGNLAGNDFWTGVSDALQTHRIRPVARLALRTETTVSAARRATESLVQQVRPPTAILVDTTLATLGALEARRSLGSDMEVMGVDSPLLQDLYPGVPRIRAPITELGMTMARVLVQLLEKDRHLEPPEMLRVTILDKDGEAV